MTGNLDFAGEPLAASHDPRATGHVLSARCWGTRGSIPSPGPSTAGAGGNTTCLEVRAGEAKIIFDAGSGLRLLGEDLLGREDDVSGSIFMTHFHWDHIQGFPFFAPLYRPGSRMRVVGPNQSSIGIKELFSVQMGPIYFPVPLEAVAAELSFEHFNEGQFPVKDAAISCMRVRHPSFTLGYRVDYEGTALCFVPDNELGSDKYGLGEDWYDDFVEFVGDADLLIHDAMYTEKEYASKVGWGHSTPEQAMRLAEEAGVRRLLFFHHAPSRSDVALNELVADARVHGGQEGMRVEVDAAREGHELRV